MPLFPDEDDEIIAEIRRYRAEYSARFGHNLDLMDEDRKRREANSPRTRVSYCKSDPDCLPDTAQYHDLVGPGWPGPDYKDGDLVEDD